MENLPKQDRNGIRLPSDIPRRFALGSIKENTEEIEQLKKEQAVDSSLSLFSTRAVQNKVVTTELHRLDREKVGTVDGKGLSDNNFTNEDKQSIHTHSNKTVLDSITQGNVNAWNSNITKQAYTVGQVYLTTTEDNPNSILGYGTWTKILTIPTEDITEIYAWVRTN